MQSNCSVGFHVSHHLSFPLARVVACKSQSHFRMLCDSRSFVFQKQLFTPPELPLSLSTQALWLLEEEAIEMGPRPVSVQ